MRARSSSTKRLGVETLQHHRREHRVHHLGGVEVALDRVRCTPGYCTLTATSTSVRSVTARCTWPMLAGGDGQIGPVEERPAPGGMPSSALDDAGRERRRHRRGVGLQGGERGLGLVGQRRR